MTDIRYYGRRVDADLFTGTGGKAIRALNRCRLFAERVTECAVAVYQALDEELPLSPVVTQLVQEGLTSPGIEGTRPPVARNLRLVPDSTEPEFDVSPFRQRNYRRRADVALNESREMRARGVSVDDDFGIHARQRPRRANRHTAGSLVIEQFYPVGGQSDE